MAGENDQDVKTEARAGSGLSNLTQSGAITRASGSELTAVTERLPGVVHVRRSLGDRIVGKFGFLLSFIVLVGLPTAAAGVYYGAIASDVYVSEAKFAVRGSVERLPTSSNAAAGIASALTALTAINSSQDAYVVAEYIRSIPLVQKLDQDKNIHALFMRNDTDPLSRLSSGYSLEQLQHYWDKMVTTTIDNVSGILTLQVRAFTSQDALTVSNILLSEAETLVNAISERRLRDAVRFADDEVVRAEQRLQAARLAVERFRNESGLLDPVKQTEATLRLLTQLQTEQIGLKNEISAARRTLNDKSPTIMTLNSRLKAMTEQIAGLQQMVTSQTEGAKTASNALFQFEGFDLERQFAEKLYLISQAGLERARMNAERQQLYLVTFVKPALAETPLFPRRIPNVILIFVCAAAIWSILCLVTAAVKDHLS